MLAFRLRSLRGEIFALLTLAVPFILAPLARISPQVDGGQGVQVPIPDLARTDLLLVVTTMLFLLLEVAGFAPKLRAAFGNRVQPLWRYARIRLEVQQYLMMKTLVSLVMGILSGIGVAIIGLDDPQHHVRRNLVSRRNCLACHTIEGVGGDYQTLVAEPTL